MTHQFTREVIPTTRAQALSLLRALDDNVKHLTQHQYQAIRKLYRLDDPRTIEQVLRAKEVAVGVLPCNTPATTTNLSTSVTVQHNTTFSKAGDRDSVLHGNTEAIADE